MAMPFEASAKTASSAFDGPSFGSATVGGNSSFGMFYSSSSDPDLSQIRKDIPRTFPEEPGVRSCSAVIEAILVEHAKFDPELGYCQGMSNVAAVVAAQFSDPIDASVFFRRLVEGLRGLWLPGFPLLSAGTVAFEAVVPLVSPMLHGHLADLGASSDMFLPDAWLTLFSRWLPFVSLWPVFIFLEREGLGGLVALTIVLLQSHEEMLLRTDDFTEVFVFLKTLGRFSEPPDIQASLSEASALLPSVREMTPVRPLLHLSSISSMSLPGFDEEPKLVRRGSRVFHANSNLEALADDLDVEALQQLAIQTMSLRSPVSAHTVPQIVDTAPKGSEGPLAFVKSCFSCCAAERKDPANVEWL